MKSNFRDALGDAFVAMGEEFPDLVVVTADVSKSTRSIAFKEKFPSRFFSVGIAEADAVGIAAGISTFDVPVIFTAYAVFATEKPFEQIRNMLCYPNLNVKVIATHGGISVGEDGVTHQAIEDIAIMRAIPNMKVLVAADPGEVKAALRTALSTKGPVYVRLGRSDAEVLHTDADGVTFPLGKAEVLRDGTDVTLAGVGLLVDLCLKAAEELEKASIHAAVINLRSVKPLDNSTLIQYARKTGAFVVAEDHNRVGGTGGAVAECLVANFPVPMEQVALDDCFAESGKDMLLYQKYGLTVENIIVKARQAVIRKQAR